MCVVELVAIEESCGNNTAGNTFLYLANEDDILNVPDPDAGTSTISTAITMKTGKQFFPFGFTEDRCRHNEATNDNDALIGTITTFFAKDDAVKRHQFFNMIGGKFAVIITDGNGETKVIRNARWRPEFDSGENPENDQNGYTATIRYKGQHAKMYTAAVPLTPAA